MRIVLLSFLVPVLIATAAFADSLSDLTSAARQGDAEAQYRLALGYLTGRDVEKDLFKAREWAWKSSDQGHPGGQTVLGVLYMGGEALDKNPARAVALWQKAAEQGLPAADYFLGKSYEEGNGVGRDLKQAAVHYQRAADKGDEVAASHLAALSKRPAGDPKITHVLGQKFVDQVRDRQRIVQEIQVGKRASGFPPAGPTQQYKGVTLVGSTYPEAQNERFFSLVQKALDMIETWPSQFRDLGREIRVVQSDPPSPARRRKGILTNITGVYTIGTDASTPGPVIIYRDLRFLSPQALAESIALNGARHREHMEMVTMAQEILAGKASNATYRRFNEATAAWNKTDVVLTERRECHYLILEKEILDAVGVPGDDRDTFGRYVSNMDCWKKVNTR